MHTICLQSNTSIGITKNRLVRITDFPDMAKHLTLATDRQAIIQVTDDSAAIDLPVVVACLDRGLHVDLLEIHDCARYKVTDFGKIIAFCPSIKILRYQNRGILDLSTASTPQIVHAEDLPRVSSILLSDHTTELFISNAPLLRNCKPQKHTPPSPKLPAAKSTHNTPTSMSSPSPTLHKVTVNRCPQFDFTCLTQFRTINYLAIMEHVFDSKTGVNLDGLRASLVSIAFTHNSGCVSLSITDFPLLERVYVLSCGDLEWLQVSGCPRISKVHVKACSNLATISLGRRGMGCLDCSECPKLLEPPVCVRVRELSRM